MDHAPQSAISPKSHSDIVGKQGGHDDSLLPAFATKQYAHLPTPQSPMTLGRYPPDLPNSPESPIHHGTSSQLSTNSTILSYRPPIQRHSSPPDESLRESFNTQCLTPESSPFIHRGSPRPHGTATPRYFHTPSNSRDFSTPKASSLSHKQELPTLPSTSSPPSNPPVLSSPFMAKLSIIDPTIKGNNAANSTNSASLDDIFSTPRSFPSDPTFTATNASITPPDSPTIVVQTILPTAGGEIERIRTQMEEERQMQLREAERRRPEYLMRAKRTLVETGHFLLGDGEETRRIEQAAPVGIMESPNKGRRLKLFQETSEESFEESLMAGGYGRYRTTDWVRQPQPLPPFGSPGSSSMAQITDEVEEERPPTEREIRKKRRLAAFQTASTQSTSKLCAVEMEGKGRVLVDVPIEEAAPEAVTESSPVKKRGGNRRKKKADPIVNDKKPLRPLPEATERPNWPDAEFPWRLRSEERAETAKAAEKERLRWIERFLDRDSDEEEVETPQTLRDDLDAAVLSRSTPQPFRSYDQFAPYPGKGKMVPLKSYSTHPNHVTSTERKAFPSDPADAVAALLSKRSVRTLSYRQQMRRRDPVNGDKDSEEVVCICYGKDDGRELVQCDACQTWYHLQCIGIEDVAELGREEDPWFCRRCVVRSRSPSLEPVTLPTSEPTFVPTDEESRAHRSSDTAFFQPSINESPHWHSRVPRTPSRSTFGHQPEIVINPNLIWTESAKINPSTPRRSAHRIHPANVRSLEDFSHHFDEMPFDPTSTPSRGIRFNASFATPKTAWPARSNTLFQTPLKGGSTRSFGGPGSLSAVLDENVANHYEPPSRVLTYEDSPIRRNRSYDGSSKRHPRSPSRTRTYIPMSVLDESPIMRSSEVQH